MKLIHSDLGRGRIKVRAENLDDLWYLSSLIDKNDIVEGYTTRKIKIDTASDRKSDVVKRTVFLKIRVEKTEFGASANSLRVSGIIVEGNDDVSKGSYHTFNVEENSIITIEKERWLNFQIEKLKEACRTKPPNILLCIFDREEAYFASLKKSGYEILTKIKGNVSKKADNNAQISNFYEEIIDLLKEYDKRFNLDRIIMASPAFWKDEFLKNLKDDELKKKIVLATCSGCDESAFNELLKRQEVRHVLKEDKITQEINLIEELLGAVAKDLAVYGFKEVSDKINIGAVKDVFISDNYIKATREKGLYDKVEAVLRTAESVKAVIHIISSDHEGGKKLDGLGGIAGILRYKINY